MDTSSVEESEILTRLRALSAEQRRRLLEAAGGLDSEGPTAKERAERRRHLRRAIELWPRSPEETKRLVEEIHALREIEE